MENKRQMEEHYYKIIFIGKKKKRDKLDVCKLADIPYFTTGEQE